jgi:hypothetical protein
MSSDEAWMAWQREVTNQEKAEEAGLGTEVWVHAVITSLSVLPVFIFVGWILELSWRQWVGWIFFYLNFLVGMGVYEELNRRLIQIRSMLKEMKRERFLDKKELYDRLRWIQHGVDELSRPSSEAGDL